MSSRYFIQALLVTLGAFLLSTTAYAAERLFVEQGDLGTNPAGITIDTGRQYGYDNIHHYTGTVAPGGYTVLTNPSTGKTVSGYIDAGGSGDLRDENGYRIIKVRPQPPPP
jgi:hypothetical protein